MCLRFQHSLPGFDRSSLLRLIAVATFFSLTLGCKTTSGPKPIGKNVELSGINQLVHQTLRDPDRAEGVIRQIDQAEKDLGQINKSFEKREKKFGSMVADHKTKGSELEIFLHDWQLEEDAFQRRLITTVNEVKRRCNPEEWAQIAPTLMNSIFSQSDRLSKFAGTQPSTGNYTNAPGPAPSPVPSQIPPPVPPLSTQPASDYAPIPPPATQPNSTKPYPTTLPPMPNLSPPPTRPQTPAPAPSFQ